MFSKIKAFVVVLYTILAGIFVYYATCFVFTLINANTQDYLLSEVSHYDFLGYYILAVVYAGICLGVLIAGIIIGVLYKAKSKQSKI
ncbi:MAG: hypothetical protein MJ174_00655 [Treponema sp.]|nr:hypothetical protein [Treponema sp.]